MTRAPLGRAGLLALLVVGLDQLTKAIVVDRIALGDRDPILPGIALTHINNDGVAFSLFSGSGKGFVIALTLVAVTGLLIYFVRAPQRRFMWVAAGLVLGGAVGNLIDRVRGEAVVDFIDPSFWPAFNVADIAITFGVVALVFAIEQEPSGERKAGDGAGAPARS